MLQPRQHCGRNLIEMRQATARTLSWPGRWGAVRLQRHGLTRFRPTSEPPGKASKGPPV